MLEEIELQKDYLSEETIETIYFGGGTPSLLSAQEINTFTQKIQNTFSLSPNAEITLEANPDDLTDEKIQSLKDTAVNRFSVGVQSFFDKDLQFMNRSHNSDQAQKSIEKLIETGFENLTIDLIFGTPGMDLKQWETNLKMAFDYQIKHLSCYSLTVEPKTALNHFIKSGKIKPLDDNKAREQFEYLIEKANSNGYIHYEISNFAAPGYFAKHNSNYWRNKSYLGIGPSAHSYNGNNRQWNIAHNIKYIKQVELREPWFTKETLTPIDQYNEYVMVSLRTIWGCNIEFIDESFRHYFLKTVQQFIDSADVANERNNYLLTHKGKFIADHIATELFWVQT